MITLAVLHIISLLLFVLNRGDSETNSRQILAFFYILSGLGMSLYFILVSLYEVF